MTSHKFKVGDRVRLVKLASTNTVEAFLNMVAATDVTKIDEHVDRPEQTLLGYGLPLAA